MRVWDISPGYLNRQSLLGEHLEIHALISVIANRKTGYSRHPETLRWKEHLGMLRRRHALVVAEMALRGFAHHSPSPHRGLPGTWPSIYIDPPGEQYRILARKYAAKSPGRIPLPKNAQDLWAQHKYSVMARDPNLYREIGRAVSRMRRGGPIDALAEQLALVLRQPVPEGRWRNALDHMWGYVADGSPKPEEHLLAEIQRRADRSEYLRHSTALGEAE